jgi:hypothetical protein
MTILFVRINIGEGFPGQKCELTPKTLAVLVEPGMKNEYLFVALSSEFSLQSITSKFFDRLDNEHRTFIEHHMADKYISKDFEECIATNEKFYDALHPCPYRRTLLY